MPSYDAIIIGGGTNGLACAGRLASAGQKVLLLEGRDRLGGGAAGGTGWDGYRMPALAHLLTHLDRRVVDKMRLEDHGLRFVTGNLPTTALDPGGNHLTLSGAAGAKLLGNIAEADKAAWSALRARLMAFAAALAPFREMTPPRIAKGAGNPYMKLGQIALGLRRLGREEFREFLRMALINVADVMEDDLTDDRLRGTIAFDTVLGAWLGPRSPNSLFLYLNRLAGAAAGQQGALALPAGGMDAVAAAMEKSAIASGVTIRRDAVVAKVVIEGDRATGVELAGGETLSAATVISAINPKTTFQTLIGPRHLDTGFMNRVADLRSRGGAAKLHLALKGTPDFRGADLQSRLVIAPSIGAVENAFNAVKYGEVPDTPVMEILLPSAMEGGHAPEGHHLLSAVVQFAPHAPKAGANVARKAMLANTLAVLETSAPGIGKQIVHSELLMPYDIEARYGMAGGNWHHGELAVEQMLFLRPFPAVSQYSTPISGFWLAGAGNHPGGGISGAAGWNAAERILTGAQP
ncbi:MAG: NAD(P)/FAD-dependent oxidoreductase [Rhodobacteraceae bacterium]|nr:NAD(P)/FAD-dependent oxidoreductase [Paracoccaceae bacterium]